MANVRPPYTEALLPNIHPVVLGNPVQAYHRVDGQELVNAYIHKAGGIYRSEQSILYMLAYTTHEGQVANYLFFRSEEERERKVEHYAQYGYFYYHDTSLRQVKKIYPISLRKVDGHSDIYRRYLRSIPEEIDREQCLSYDYLIDNGMDMDELLRRS